MYRHREYRTYQGEGQTQASSCNQPWDLSHQGSGETASCDSEFIIFGIHRVVLFVVDKILVLVKDVFRLIADQQRQFAGGLAR